MIEANLSLARLRERHRRIAIDSDVLIYLLRLAEKLNVDVLNAAIDKMALNEAKYPVDRVRGSPRKYTEY